MKTEHDNEPQDDIEGYDFAPFRTFYGKRTLGDQDHVDDFVEQAFALEVIKCSLEEIEFLARPERLSSPQLFSVEHALAYADDALQFVVGEAGNWGLHLDVIQSGIERRWCEYLNFMTPAGASPPVQSRRKFIEGWKMTRSLAFHRPEWLEGS